MNKDRRIVIVGFMGSGKTTVAHALARQLACDFVDLDSFITKHEGRTPAAIIEQDGEPAFRLVETNALHDVLEKNEAHVIALGGGAWTIEANRALVADHDCLSVWLDAPFELCWERIMSSRAIRPLAPDLESAQRLFRSRLASYEIARLSIDASQQTSIAEIIEGIRLGLQEVTSTEGATD